ncbi:MAG TPA: PQQ-dependent dehydrogenase, methanol/ethanol family [Bryobacteraceae bacterium]|nr:PQQ-dependent dehydrogenase, methanol/ethanol family [Bryobacteraceae bacterium]
MFSRVASPKHSVLLMVAATALAQTPEQIDQGRRLFEASCASCHGQNAKGGRGPDLTGKLNRGSLESEIADNITGGIAGTQMPAFPMPGENVRAIVAFLKSLRPGETDLALAGNVDSGQRLFFGAAGCSRCHMYRGQGGRLGPDLSRIGEARSARELQRAIAQPHRDMVRGFETVEVHLKNGSEIRGVRKNEDTFSLQVMDPSEKLHLLAKKDVASVRLTGKSLMPEGAASGPQLDDVIAFLKAAPSVNAPSGSAAGGGVSFERLKSAAKEPQNWLSYYGDLGGNHYSGLSSITPSNVRFLASAWAYQFGGTRVETTPLVVDGVMYVTGPRNNAAALDARTGRAIWHYARRLPADIHSNCTVMTNRGLATLGDRLYMATLDAHLVALDAKTGNPVWDVMVDDYKRGTSITHAPLAIDGKIIVGITAGECALSGFLDAYDAATGRRLWRFNVTPAKGDPARSTWAGDSADFGGGPTWMTGTYDAATDTLFWSTGNPSPDYDGTVRAGDNLYTCSVLALDPNTGKLKWYFQFTPHDTHDWDAAETNVLADGFFRGKMRHVILHADRNAFFYVLDRETGEFLLGKPFAKQNWATGLDDHGRPVLVPNMDPTPQGTYVCPDASGATNWASPSWDPQTKLFYLAVRESCAVYTSVTKTPRPGEPYTGTGQQEEWGLFPGAIRAIDPQTGQVKWSFNLHQGSVGAGVLATAGGVVFAAAKDGNLIALEARTGAELWHYQTGAEIIASPISYSVDGKQYVAIATDSALFTFALP